MEDKIENPGKGRWKNHPSATVKCIECGTEFRVRYSRKDRSKYCSFICKQKGAGKAGGAIRGEQMKAQSKKVSYPKIGGRHAHRIIAEQKLGRSLKKGEVVHHKDEDIQNYDPANLEILPSQSEHMKIHRGKIMTARNAN